MEKFVKVLDRFIPFYFSLGYFVEFPFDLRREIIVENIGEMFGQEIVYDDTYVGRQQFAFSAPTISVLSLSVIFPFLSVRVL